MATIDYKKDPATLRSCRAFDFLSDFSDFGNFENFGNFGNYKKLDGKPLRATQRQYLFTLASKCVKFRL